jgi:hypothetical protein
MPVLAVKPGRNQPCPCGSGKKYKHCCGSIVATARLREPVAGPATLPFASAADRQEAQEFIRRRQQGLGRPILAAKLGDHQFVTVGKTHYRSASWKTFPDFLNDYIRRILDPAWGNAEIAKPLSERHPILQWYDAFCRHQRTYIHTPGVVGNGLVTGVVACYLGLAYSLYLLDHNVELQARLVRRLKNMGNFQGAYYELMVANALIRAGFTLTLEDETDPKSKHCEFAAISCHTGKRYWVEAKMRSVVGLLGKTRMDGGPDGKPLSQLIRHLNAALAKPAADERLIFIDLNAAPQMDDSKPAWVEQAATRLEHYEAHKLATDVTAYLMITNMPFHRELDRPIAPSILPFGLGLPDFNRPGYYRLAETYRRHQRHIDAHKIGEALAAYPQLPSAFDGRLPSEVFGRGRERIAIGQTYFFDSIGEKGMPATVTTSSVDEVNKQVVVGVTALGGSSYLLAEPMTDEQLAEYKAYPEAYFGKVMQASKKVTTPYELFEFWLESHKHLSREQLLIELARHPNIEALRSMSTEDLLVEYAEGMVAVLQQSGFKLN